MSRPRLRNELLSGTSAASMAGVNFKGRSTTLDAPDADTPSVGHNKPPPDILTGPPEILTGKEASAFLWEYYRLQRSERRLAQLRAQPVGAGPPFHRDGCAVRYRRASLIEWAQKQLGREHGNTSDEQAFRQSQRSAT